MTSDATYPHPRLVTGSEPAGTPHGDDAAQLDAEIRLRSALLEAIPNPIYFKDLQGRYLGFNQAWQETFGASHQWIGKTVKDRVPGEPGEMLYARECELLAQGGVRADEGPMPTADGRERIIIDNQRVFADAEGRPAGIIGVIIDVTETRQAEQKLRESEEKFRLIAENVGDLVALLDRDGRRLYNSPSYRQIFGNDGFGPDSFVEIHPEDRERIREVFRHTVETGQGQTDEFRFLAADGTVRYIESRGSVIRDTTGAVSKVIVVSRDVTDRKESEARIRHLAQHDGLTGLPNRALLLDRLTQAIARAQRGGGQVAVLFVDLDRFKIINDSLGHEAGDRVLITVARRLTGALRESDTVARIGGDEFVVLLSDTLDQKAVAGVARKLLAALSAPIDVNGQGLTAEASIGIALYEHDGATAQALLRKADTAMYHAKAAGRNTYLFFTAEMNAAVQHRLAVETGLRQALAREEFVLHYQPQVDATSGALVGVEALIRWRNPTSGLLFPGAFIGVAEDLGLIVPIGAWVLRRACAQVMAWQAAGLGRFRVAVNVSARQFARSDLSEVVREVLAETGLPPELLDLEITETEMMQQTPDAMATLQRIHDLGVGIAVDDFGIGYSSLGYIKRLPIDRLKIDKSFVRDIETDRDDAAITTAVIAMAHELGLKVVAEGVETAAQLEFLKSHGCDEAQGYFIARPMPEENVPAFVERLRTAPAGALSPDDGD